MRAGMLDEVGVAMREAAASIVMPRFRALQAGEVEEKTPGEWVTVVDREAEKALTAALLSLLPGSRVIGEEQCAADPSCLHGLDEGRVWLVDPLDGTNNFIAGKPDFAVMVALLQEGESVAAWILAPTDDVMFRAELGAGAFRDDVRLHAADGAPGIERLRGAIMRKYMPSDVRAAVEQRLARIGEVLPGAYCAGVDYPAVTEGKQDFILYYRTLPWDHAPGVLLAREAGAAAARWDGTPYRAADDTRGLLVARNRATWDQASEALLR